MQFMLQGVATMADMFAWQKWMHSMTYKHTHAIMIKYSLGIAIFITCRPHREVFQNIVLLPMFKFLLNLNLFKVSYYIKNFCYTWIHVHDFESVRPELCANTIHASQRVPWPKS